MSPSSLYILKVTSSARLVKTYARVRRTSKQLHAALLTTGLSLIPGTFQAQNPPSVRSTDVVDLGEVSATRLDQSLGVGIAPSGLQQDWQFAAAKAMGASWVRIQCSWQSVEQQSDAPLNKPADPRFVQTPACASALTSAAKYGLHVTETAAYGPPFHSLLYATMPEGAAAGQTTLQIKVVAGMNGSTIANLKPLYDYICPAVLNDAGAVGKVYRCQTSIGSHASPPGTLITVVRPIDATHANISLASSAAKVIPKNVSSPQECSIQAGSKTLTCADGNFDATWTDGVQITVPGAGARGPLTTVVASVQSPQLLTLRMNASKSVSNVIVDANRVYIVGEILYPSTGSDRANDPSVSAYADYATFLANDMASHGVSGDIEIWNEPPWRNDSWDFRPGLYDSANSGVFKNAAKYNKGAVVTENSTLYASLVDQNQGHDPAQSPKFWSTTIPPNVFPGPPLSGANFGFAANLQHRQFPSGVTATWNGTSGNGATSLLGPQMSLYSGESLMQPASVITRESFHPYGGAFNNPEDTLMRPDCLRSTARVAGNPFKNGQNCFLPGEVGGANLMQAVEYDLSTRLNGTGVGLGHSITETNAGVPGPGLQVAQARSNVRQFLGFTALGISPIEFFQLWDGAHRDPTYSLVDYDGTNMRALPSYTTLSGLMSDLRPLTGPSSNVSSRALLGILSYSGTYPLTTLHIVGARDGASAGSERFVVWQLTAAPGFVGSISGNTLQVTAITSGPNVLTSGELVEGRGIPAGTTITGILNATGGPGTYSISGSPLALPQEAMNVDWATLPSPRSGTVAIAVPPTLHVSGAIDLITRKSVPLHQSGQGITLQVEDDPVEIIADPR